MIPDAEPWLTKREIAAHYAVSPRTVERQKWPHTVVGKQNRYRVSEVDPYLAGRQDEWQAKKPNSNVSRTKRMRSRVADWIRP